MVKYSFKILFSVQFRPDSSLLFLLEWQALQLRHTREMREKWAPLKPFLLPAASLKTGCSALSHPSRTRRNSIPALGLGLVGTVEVVLGNANDTHLVIRGGVLFPQLPPQGPVLLGTYVKSVQFCTIYMGQLEGSFPL